MIRVFVRASSAVELAGLEALVRSASSLQLAGSSLGKTDAPTPLADADVLLERPLLSEINEAQLGEDEARPPMRVWLVTEAEFAPGMAAIRDGTVRALLPAWATGEEIRLAIEATAAGLVVLHPDLAEQAAFASMAPVPAADSLSAAPGSQLSPREAEVLNLLAGGLGNKQIAARLGISEHTVKFHVTSIFNKLGASSRAEAVAIGLRRGLIVL